MAIAGSLRCGRGWFGGSGRPPPRVWPCRPGGRRLLVAHPKESTGSRESRAGWLLQGSHEVEDGLAKGIRNHRLLIGEDIGPVLASVEEQ